MKTRTRRLTYTLLLLLAGAGVALLLRPARVVVETGVVDRGPLRVVLEAEGESRIDPRHVVAAPVSGRLAPVTLREGDRVRRGQVVAVLRPAPLDSRDRERAEAVLQAALDTQREAESKSAEAAAALAQARSTLQRNEQLAASGILAPETLDQLRSAERGQAKALAAARARVEVTRHGVESARATLLEAAPEGESAQRPLALKAPGDGTVLRLAERSERVIPAGTPILEIGDPADLEAIVDVLSTDAVAIPAGAAVELDVGGGKTLPARVRRIEPAAFTKVSPLGVEEQRVYVVADLLSRSPALGDRYRVEARIVLWQGEGLLRVPAGALFRRGEGWGAYVVEGGRARLRTVRIGHRNPQQAEVLAGLRPGDRVVLYPSDQIEEGSRLEVR